MGFALSKPTLYLTAVEWTDGHINESIDLIAATDAT